MTRARDVANIDGILTTTGDTYYASAAATPTRLGIGSTGNVLTVAGGVPTWAAPAAGGGWTLINTGGTTLSGATTTISSIPGTYQSLVLVVQNFRPASDTDLRMYFNGDTASRYQYVTQESGNVSFGQSNMMISGDTDAGAATSGLSVTTITDYANTVTWKTMSNYSFTNYYLGTGTSAATITWGAYNQTGAITSLTLKPTSGNFTSGTAYLYGVK